MRNYHVFSTVSALLIASAVTVGAGAAQAATENTTSDVRKEEEHRLKKQSKVYSKQAKALANQYRQSAKQVERQGGDPTPLIEAANYFDAEAKAK